MIKRLLRRYLRGRPLTADEREIARLRSLPRFTPLTCHLAGTAMEAVDGPSTASQFEYIFQRGCYGFKPTSPAPFIIDCGANIGLGILYWKRQFPDCRILAFEADPFVFPYLQRNVAAWGLSGVELVPCALWHVETSIAFRSNQADGGHVVMDVSPSDVRVRARPLSPYLHQPVDLLKMDIEGAEVNVIAECRSFLSNIRQIFVEYHSWVEEQQRLDELLKILHEAQFRYYIHPELESPNPFLKVDIHQGKDLRLNVFGVRGSQFHIADESCG
jgi:FkbM family methyltransferase